jgi:nucleotide-binding universal stress UspA family protein
VSVPLQWEALQHRQLYPRLDGALRAEADNGHTQLPGQGRVGDEIVEAAEDADVDLVVLCSRGMSRVE